jgi:uncharacterized metal-binding protein YceD (DUF177 family)
MLLFKEGCAMPDHDAESRSGSETPALPRHVLRLSDPGHRGVQEVLLTPDAEARAAIAAHLGIPAIRKLRFAGRLAPEGRRDWVLEATLGATVVQDCVITLAPVTTRIDEPVTRHYMADLPDIGPAAGHAEVEMPEDDSLEPLPASLDLAEVMIEALSLALPPFPRAEGAALGEITVTEPGAVPLDAETVRPFAGLAGLKDRLGGGGNPGGDTD